MAPLRLLLLAAPLALGACAGGSGEDPFGGGFEAAAPDRRPPPAVGPGNPVSRGMAG